MSNVEDVEVFAGEDRTQTLHARDSANLPASLTGKTVAWYVGRPPWAPDLSSAIFSKTGTTISATAGTFSVVVVPADTLRLEGDYEHMAKTTDGTGLVAVVSMGRFRVNGVLVP